MKKRGLLGLVCFILFLAAFLTPISSAHAEFPFPIATTSGREMSVSAAFDGTNFLVGIQGDASNDYNITAQLASQSGSLVGSRISVGRTGGVPYIAFDGTNYLMVWQDDANKIYGQFISPSGSPVNTPFIIADLPSGLGDMGGIAFGGGKYLMAYYRDDTPLDGITNRKAYVATVSTAGAVTADIAVSAGYGCCGSFNVAFDGTNFLVGWTDDINMSEVKGRFVAPDGSLAGSEFTINASSYLNWDNSPTIAFDGANYLVLWHDDVDGNSRRHLRGQLVNTSGANVGGVIEISTASAGKNYPASAAFDGTNYLVAWTDMHNDANNNFTCGPGEATCLDIYGQFINTAGALVGSAFPISMYPGDQIGICGGFGGGKYLGIGNALDGVGGSAVSGKFILPFGTSGTGSISGYVTYSVPQTGNIYIAAWITPVACTNNPDPSFIVELTSLPDSYTLNLPDGTYYIGGTIITGGPDASPKETDPWGVFGGCSSAIPITISGGNSVTGIDFLLLDGTVENPNPLYSKYPAYAYSEHFIEGYYAFFGVDDPTYQATTVIVTGPGITDSLNLVYEAACGCWNNWNNGISFGATHPSAPLTYNFTINDSAGVSNSTDLIDNFVELFAANLSPSGGQTVSSNPTFSWTGVGAGYTYGVEVNDSAGSRIWDIYDLTGTSTVYGGPALTNGATYYYYVLVRDMNGNSSFSPASFVYQTAPTPLYIAWLDDTYGNNEIFLRKSTDSGLNWTTTRLTNNPGSSVLPSIALNGDEIYVVWEDDTYGNYEIFLKKSTDGGVNWTTTRLTNNMGDSHNPAITVSGNNVYVVWQDNTYGNYEIFLKKSTDGGVNWTTTRLTNNTGNSALPSIALNGNEVYIAWQDDTYGNFEIYLKKSSDGGTSWTTTRLTNNPGISLFPAMVVNGNEVYVAWQDDTYGNNEIYLKKSTDGGTNWVTTRLTNNIGNSQSPAIAVNGSNAYVVWQDDTYGNNEIYLKKSTDGGVNWTTTRLTNNAGISQFPVIAIKGGDLYVVWMDDTYGNYEIFLKKSTDGGMNWTTTRLTNNTGISARPALPRY